MNTEEHNAADRVFALSVVQRLRGSGYEALWAGGCVRDLLLGNQPSDYDVATSATPEDVRALFGRRRTLAVGAAFGVIIVLSQDRNAQQVEVATFRTDAGYSDGRRPDSVVFSTAKEDAQRRDFTINGMFYDPLTEEFIDYVGGREDLTGRIVRAIGQAEERIGEDKLRMLRAIRFAARFDFELDAQTRAAVTLHANEISVVSGERIAVEIQKTLQTERAAWAVDSWFTTGLMRNILPEIEAKWMERAADALTLLDAVRQVKHVGTDWRLRLATLIFSALDTQATRATALDSLRLRLKLANEDVTAMGFALATQEVLQNAETQKWSSVQPLLIQPHARVALGLLVARNLLGDVADRTITWLQERMAWPQEQLNPPPLVDGSDLISLGLPPGPKFSELLGRVRCMQLDAELSHRPAALTWLKSQVA